MKVASRNHSIAHINNLLDNQSFRLLHVLFVCSASLKWMQLSSRYGQLNEASHLIILSIYAL